MIPRVDASLISEMKDMAEENRRLNRMYAEINMQNDLLKEALGKSVKAVSSARTCRDIAAQCAAGQWMEWAEKRNVRLEYIQRGKPQQNAYIERYNRTVRPSHRNLVATAGQWDEWLGQNLFEAIEEAQHQATEWLWAYNNERPNMGIGGMTPAMKLKTAA